MAKTNLADGVVVVVGVAFFRSFGSPGNFPEAIFLAPSPKNDTNVPGIAGCDEAILADGEEGGSHARGLRAKRLRRIIN